MSNDAESEAPRAEARGIFVEPSDLSAEAIRAKGEAKNTIPPFGNPQGFPAKEGDVVHLTAGEHLPAVPVPSPTTEMLKQLLAQMLENERRRLRNEYVRITMLFLMLLAAAIGGGLWFAHSLLDQLRAERQMTDRSLRALLQRVTSETPSPEPSDSVPTLDSPGRPVRHSLSDGGSAPAEPGAQRPVPRSPGVGGSTLPPSPLGLRRAGHAPAPAADTNTVQAQADIKRLIADLEAEKQALADMLKSQDAQTKNLLKSRDSELQILHERMQEVQRKIMNAAPPEARPVKETEAPQAIETKAADSLTVTTSNAVTLRLPIPSP